MKNFSQALKAFLQSNTAYGRADLFSITCGPAQNLLAWSQDLSQTDAFGRWTVFGSGTTVTPPTVTDPLGGSTANQITYNGADAAGGVRVGQNALVIPLPSGIPLTASIWLRANSPVTVALSSGTAGPSNVNVTTTWQRFAITGNSTGVQVPLLYIQSPAGVNTAFTIFAWGAQLEMAATASPYNQTAAVPTGIFGPAPTTIFATSCQLDLSFGGNTYFAAQMGAWERGKITSEASFDLRGGSMELNLICPPSLLFPIPLIGQAGSLVPMMQAIAAGLFDGALVRVSTAYYPVGATTSAAINAAIAQLGLETKFAGYIMPNGEMRRDKVEFEVADPLFILNQKIPRNVMQAGCMLSLFDFGCGILPGGSPTLQFVSGLMTVASGSSRQQLNTTASLGQSPPYFTQGYVVFFSGQNAGMAAQIKSQSSTTQILLANPVPFPLAIGDTFMAFAGCDKTAATCQSKFNNFIHFKAMPFTPNPEMAI